MGQISRSIHENSYAQVHRLQGSWAIYKSLYTIPIRIQCRDEFSLLILYIHIIICNVYACVCVLGGGGGAIEILYYIINPYAIYK